MSSLNTCVTAGTRRLDPQTGMPFVRGACREDGYRFVTYQKAAVRKCDVLCANCHRIKTVEGEEWRIP